MKENIKSCLCCIYWNEPFVKGFKERDNYNNKKNYLYKLRLLSRNNWVIFLIWSWRALSIIFWLSFGDTWVDYLSGNGGWKTRELERSSGEFSRKLSVMIGKRRTRRGVGRSRREQISRARKDNPSYVSVSHDVKLFVG